MVALLLGFHERNPYFKEVRLRRTRLRVEQTIDLRERRLVVALISNWLNIHSYFACQIVRVSILSYSLCVPTKRDAIPNLSQSARRSNILPSGEGGAQLRV